MNMMSTEDGMCNENFVTHHYYPDNHDHLCWEEEGHDGDHWALLEVGPGWRIKAIWSTEDR